MQATRYLFVAFLISGHQRISAVKMSLVLGSVAQVEISGKTVTRISVVGFGCSYTALYGIRTLSWPVGKPTS